VRARTQTLTLKSTIGAIASAATLLAFPPPGKAADPPGAARVDTALIMAVDVSGSVDEHRYRLQMDGIARALVDPAVVNVIVSGQSAAILFSIVTWADHPRMALPWVRISNQGEAEIAAALVRALPREGGNFTCMARMLRHLADKVVPQIPAVATRVVVDVSGDGRDNCNPAESVAAIRDELSGAEKTINGLPILEGREADTLEAWYRQNVKGGPGSFVLPALGYEDFGRAIRQKFVTEISHSITHGAIHVAGLIEIESTVTADKPDQTR
jgi:Protein of unknown function (DUF1194)